MTFLVQIITGNEFRDEYVQASSVAEAIAIARSNASKIEQRWASFVA